MKNKIFKYLTLQLTLFSSLLLAQYPQMDFPLQIGNRWQYSEDPELQFYESQATRDTTMPNSLTYTQIEGVLYDGFFRKEGPKIFSYSTSTNTESLLYDFSLKAGDTLSIKIFDEDTIVTTVSSEGITTIFGQERYYMTFLKDNLASSGHGYSKIVNGLGFVQYHGEVFYHSLIGAIIDGIKYGVILDIENPDSNLPSDFRLFQNYPNPFNPVTNISYTIPEAGEVVLTIYNTLGEKISILVNEYQNPGSYKVSFNAKKLSSGVYFYSIQANEFYAVKKMILLK